MGNKNDQGELRQSEAISFRIIDFRDDFSGNSLPAELKQWVLHMHSYKFVFSDFQLLNAFTTLKDQLSVLLVEKILWKYVMTKPIGFYTAFIDFYRYLKT